MANCKTFSKTNELVKKMKKERGFALVLVLAISVISLALIGAIFYVVLNTTSFSSKSKYYLQSIEVAKGVSQAVIYKLTNNNLVCIGKNCSTCNKGCYVDVSDISSKFPNFNISVKVETKIPLTTSDIYGFLVTVKRKNSVEQSKIEFLYKKVR